MLFSPPSPHLSSRTIPGAVVSPLRSWGRLAEAQDLKLGIFQSTPSCSLKICQASEVCSSFCFTLWWGSSCSHPRNREKTITQYNPAPPGLTQPGGAAEMLCAIWGGLRGGEGVPGEDLVLTLVTEKRQLIKPCFPDTLAHLSLWPT